MTLKLVSGTANPGLALAVADALGIELTAVECEPFPDGELNVRVLETVRGADLYILQPTCPPVADNLLQLLLLADAARRAGASRITAVVPYFGYARQDRRARGRQAVAARLVADLFAVGGIQRLIVVDAHTAAIEGFSPVPVEHLSAVPLLAEALRASLDAEQVVVAPDLGAVRLAERYSDLLGLPAAFISKVRVSGEEVRVRAVTGEVAGRPVVIVDDMITTAGTVDAAARALLKAGCREGVTIAATHGILVGPAAARLRDLQPVGVITTDSAPQQSGLPFPHRVVSIAGLLAQAIDRLHNDRSLSDLISFV